MRQRFVFLDGLRGIAALAVACCHAGFDFNLSVYPKHGYLAVDFFFCLSGFVISYAYDARLKTGMPFARFAAARIIRLYPMILLATPIAAVIFIAGRFLPGGTALELALLCLSGLVMLPAGLLYNMQAFPLNGPLWSLFFEFFANGLFFLEARQPALPPRKYTLFLGLIGVALVLLIYKVGKVEAVGFASPISFCAGFIRVLFSFLAGILIHRFAVADRIARCPAWLLALILAVILCWPETPFAWAYDSVAIVLVFPLLVASGARVVTHGRIGKIWQMSGLLSYPLYVIHQPLIRAVFEIFRPLPRSVLERDGIALGAVAFCLLATYVVTLFYDVPVRRWLNEKQAVAFLQKAPQKTSAPGGF